MPLKGALPRIGGETQTLANGRVRLQLWVLPVYKVKLREEAIARNGSIADVLEEILAQQYPDVHESEE